MLKIIFNLIIGCLLAVSIVFALECQTYETGAKACNAEFDPTYKSPYGSITREISNLNPGTDEEITITYTLMPDKNNKRPWALFDDTLFNAIIQPTNSKIKKESFEKLFENKDPLVYGKLAFQEVECENNGLMMGSSEWGGGRYSLSKFLDIGKQKEFSCTLKTPSSPMKAILLGQYGFGKRADYDTNLLIPQTIINVGKYCEQYSCSTVWRYRQTNNEIQYRVYYFITTYDTDGLANEYYVIKEKIPEGWIAKECDLEPTGNNTYKKTATNLKSANLVLKCIIVNIDPEKKKLAKSEVDYFAGEGKIPEENKVQKIEEQPKEEPEETAPKITGSTVKETEQEQKKPSLLDRINYWLYNFWKKVWGK